MGQTLTSTTIDKNIPIYQIVISGNEISEFYSKKSVYSFAKLGYNNIIRVEATTPKDQFYLKFADKRYYTADNYREWRQEELAIWHSHYDCWKRIKEPSIVIEHDCILYRELPEHFMKRNLWSFGVHRRPSPVGWRYVNLAGLCYYIKRSGAHELMKRMPKLIHKPVDAYLHRRQKWYPHGILPPEYIEESVCATHYINKKVGTTKPTIRKKALGK